MPVNSTSYDKGCGQGGSINKKTKAGGIDNLPILPPAPAGRLPLTMSPGRRYSKFRTTLRCTRKPEAVGWRGHFFWTFELPARGKRLAAARNTARLCG